METERLKLVPPSMDLQPQLLEAIVESQSELSVYLPWVPYALTEEESIEEMKRAINNFENFEGELRHLIIEKCSGRLVGAIGLIIRDKSVPFFEIGYWLRSSCVGLGYMTEALNRLEEKAFVELKANRVEIKAAEENIKSWSIAKRCGYAFEGTLRNDRRLPSGELNNTVVYAKTGLSKD
ncbi:GNAT family N-acetyltransferase [Aliivibrio kagoshimensis]|uniref:GNAT family N-acetyltransferase n=1 Tax=Aliivibrio kagoshimensis TaxID=2910230 RepID=UPI003D0C6539